MTDMEYYSKQNVTYNDTYETTIFKKDATTGDILDVYHYSDNWTGNYDYEMNSSEIPSSFFDYMMHMKQEVKFIIPVLDKLETTYHTMNKS